MREGENVRVLFPSERYLRLLGWSRSGEDILVVSTKGESFATPTVRDAELIKVSASASDHDTIARFKSTYPFSMRLSPNRDEVVFISREDEKDDIWVLPTAGGKARRMTGNRDPSLYFSSPSWSPDGKTVYYGRQERHNLVSMIEGFR